MGLLLMRLLVIIMGGGHKYASGARITSLEEVDLFIKELDELCEEYKRASISNIEL